MSNNKQSSIEYYAFEALRLRVLLENRTISVGEYAAKHHELLEQAKAMNKKETIDFALHCMMQKMNPDKSTIEVVSDIYDEFFGGDQ